MVPRRACFAYPRLAFVSWVHGWHIRQTPPPGLRGKAWRAVCEVVLPVSCPDTGQLDTY